MKKMLMLLISLAFITGLNPAGYASLDDSVVVVSYGGDANVVHAGKIKSVLCEKNMELEAGARVVTGPRSYVELAFNRKKTNIVKIMENSEVVIKLTDGDKIELINGRVFTVLRGLEKGTTFRVRTPNAVCGARGTGWLTEVFGKLTRISVLQSKVFIRGVKKDGSVMDDLYWTGQGFSRSVNKFNAPGDKKKIPAGQLEKLRKEAGMISGDKKEKQKDRKAASKKRDKRLEATMQRRDNKRSDRGAVKSGRY